MEPFPWHIVSPALVHSYFKYKVMGEIFILANDTDKNAWSFQEQNTATSHVAFWAVVGAWFVGSQGKWSGMRMYSLERLQRFGSVQWSMVILPLWLFPFQINAPFACIFAELFGLDAGVVRSEDVCWIWLWALIFFINFRIISLMASSVLMGFNMVTIYLLNTCNLSQELGRWHWFSCSFHPSEEGAWDGGETIQFHVVIQAVRKIKQSLSISISEKLLWE